MSNYVYPP